jgi:glucose-6-phosphate isomerase
LIAFLRRLGKEKNLAGEIVHQGIAVYGHKASTDQHSFVQQLRDGRAQFLCDICRSAQRSAGRGFDVEDETTIGDYLAGFLRGTRSALYENGRESITMSVPEVNAFYIGELIALHERAVGFCGSLVNINAYDQPGVEAGKQAASNLLRRQKKVRAELSGEGKTAEEIARPVDADPEDVFHLLRHPASNDSQIRVAAGDEAVDYRFSLGESRQLHSYGG